MATLKTVFPDLVPVEGEGEHCEDAGGHRKVRGEAHHLAVGSTKQPHPSQESIVSLLWNGSPCNILHCRQNSHTLPKKTLCHYCEYDHLAVGPTKQPHPTQKALCHICEADRLKVGPTKQLQPYTKSIVPFLWSSSPCSRPDQTATPYTKSIERFLWSWLPCSRPVQTAKRLLKKALWHICYSDHFTVGLPKEPPTQKKLGGILVKRIILP
jgi:hypothetical protein